MSRTATGAAFVLALGGAACSGWRPGPPRTPPLLRFGPERTSLPYEDPRLAEKRVLLERMNRDRVRSGAPPLQYEPRASLVGDLFCLDAALSGSRGHWDARGQAPYLRWGLAGGVDFHSQNAVAISSSSGRMEKTLADLLLQAQEAMMAETPPQDGHRRLILNPSFTHVGIGVALVGGEFRMSQEFTRVAFDWIEIPSGPLRAGTGAWFGGQPLPTWEVRLVEIRFEPPPRPLPLLQLRQAEGYAYPAIAQSLRLPFPPDPRVSLRFPLDRGAGHYFVVCHVRARRSSDATLFPATAALVTALP